MVRLTLKSGSSIVECLDSLRADVLFGWRQIRKNKVTSAAAIVSLALAMGASISAFRLIDALLLRPLPVSEPERLYSLSRQGIGAAASHDGWEYRLFRPLRAAVKGQAELIAVSFAEHADLTYSSDEEMEKAHVQYVSGWMFSTFGLKPALGRVLGYGTVIVRGTGGTPEVFPQIARPLEFREQVQRQIAGEPKPS